MEIMVGPAFTIDVPSSPPHVPPECDDGDRPTINDGAVEREASTSLSEDGSGFHDGGKSRFFAGDSSESSSSIGTPDENDDVSSQKEEDEEVQSKLKGLGSLESLEDSLPIKRGLSRHFAGKSKSFTDLSQVSSVKELKKTENPFNKRRRVQIASRRSSFYAYSNPMSMPLFPLHEDPESEEEHEEKEEAPSSSSAEEKNRVPQSYMLLA